jgi:hypothetical protein
MVGYFLALVTCILVLTIFGVGQPALLYISPGILIPTIYAAWRKGDLGRMWNKLDENVCRDNNRHDFEVLGKEPTSTEIPQQNPENNEN